jgi:hypothetical protein
MPIALLARELLQLVIDLTLDGATQRGHWIGTTLYTSCPITFLESGWRRGGRSDHQGLILETEEHEASIRRAVRCQQDRGPHVPRSRSASLLLRSPSDHRYVHAYRAPRGRAVRRERAHGRRQPGASNGHPRADRRESGFGPNSY